MENKELLSKISHNKVFLFIVPNLIYIYKFCSFYNSNSDVDHALEMNFRELFFLSLMFFFITSFVYFILNKALKDYQKVFCVSSIICCFYFFKFTLIQFLLFIVCVLILMIDLKKFIKFKLDTGVCLASFIIIAIFCTGFFLAIYNSGMSVLKTKSYDNDFKINVSDDTKTPNIYYIHCDGMLGISTMKKYFQYSDTYLTNYLEDNNYYLNEDANFVNGHKTQRSLVALFNPNYYDNFFKEYLDDIEDYYLDKKDNSSFNVSYYELEDKRFNNELFRSLKKKGYTTIGIGEYNQYTSLNTDYYYDYYVLGLVTSHLIDGEEGLRLITNDTKSKKRNLSYANFLHFGAIANNTIIYDIVNSINYSNYEDVNYKDYDTSEYEYIDNSEYWVAKAILKGLDESMKIDDNRFVFIDYNLNHLNLTFDKYGNRLDEENGMNLSYYVGNYIYSTYLLVDMLEFIKNNDEEAIIIIEGDHGIHMLENDFIMNRFSTDINGLQEIRNSVISSIYIPDKYKNGDEDYLDNPLNISRYIVNNYVGDNYEYLK